MSSKIMCRDSGEVAALRFSSLTVKCCNFTNRFKICKRSFTAKEDGDMRCTSLITSPKVALSSFAGKFRIRIARSISKVLSNTKRPTVPNVGIISLPP